MNHSVTIPITMAKGAPSVKKCIKKSAVPLPTIRGECEKLGRLVLRQDVNGKPVSCRGKWEFECEQFGSCRINDPRAEHNCQTCPAHTEERAVDEKPEFDRRHLLYHIYPMRETGTWQRNVELLLGRMHLFNGKRVIAIVTDEKCDPIGAVKQAFRGFDCEFIELENDGLLREVVSWIPLWERVIDEPGCTFYAHAKGVTRPVNPGVSCHVWADILYETLLDYWPAVKNSLASNEITGTMKKVGRGFSGCPSMWHYSGSFFWTRNALFRRRKWRQVPQFWWGTEAITGTLYRPEEAGCIFHEGRQHSLDCYSPDYMNKVVLPELRAWRAANTSNHSGIGSLTTPSLAT